MAKKSSERTNPEREIDAVATRLGALTTLGVASSLWALFLWTELVASRSGGAPLCALGGDDCGALWDGAFASRIQGATGLPVAAWGLVWGLVAFVLPLLVLVRGRAGRPTESLQSAVGIVGAVGGVGVVALLAASAVAGMFCGSCAITYVATLLYAAVAVATFGSAATAKAGPGLVGAAVATVGAYVLLLYPGLQTPRSLAEEGDRALAAAVDRVTTTESVPTGVTNGAVPEADRKLQELIASLPPSSQQALADSLMVYGNSPLVESEPARNLHGPATAPVRVTDFTDVLCSHCASLSDTMDYVATLVPAGSFSSESRHFPLDGNCNPQLQIRGPESVRCLATRARICLDATPDGKSFAKELYRRQQNLTPAMVYAAAEPFLSREELERCVASDETAAALASDIEWAWRFEPDGTPLVLVNGRQGTSFGPFIYAMILTGGGTEHPAFDALPPANPNAHIH